MIRDGHANFVLSYYLIPLSQGQTWWTDQGGRNGHKGFSFPHFFSFESYGIWMTKAKTEEYILTLASV